MRLIEGLAGAAPDDLAAIEITPAGLGLHWPRLDADLYIPALMQGCFGSKRWMAAQLGAEGGRARSDAKTAASVSTAATIIGAVALAGGAVIFLTAPARGPAEADRVAVVVRLGGVAVQGRF